MMAEAYPDTVASAFFRCARGIKGVRTLLMEYHKRVLTPFMQIKVVIHGTECLVYGGVHAGRFRSRGGPDPARVEVERRRSLLRRVGQHAQGLHDYGG